MDFYQGNKHKFGQYLTDIDYSEKILEENKLDRVAKELGDYIYDQYFSTKNKNKHKSKNIAATKAKSILNPKKRESYAGLPPKDVSSLTAIERKKILIDAVNKGYITDFILHEPWHISVFKSENEPTTFPFQHESVITYSKRGIHEFFSKEYCDEIVKEQNWYEPDNPKRDRFFRHKSIFRVGALKAGNSHHNKERYKEYAENQKASGTYIWGLYTHPSPSPRGAQNATRGVILEIQAPTNSIIISPEDTELTDKTRIENLEQCKEYFGKPENYGADQQYNIVIEPTMELGNNDYAVPLEWVTGVHDPELCDNEEFVSLDSYKKYLYENHREKMPNGNLEVSESREKLHNYLEGFKRVREFAFSRGHDQVSVRNATRQLSNYNDNLENLIEAEYGRKRRNLNYFELVEDYNKAVSDIHKLFEEVFDLDPDKIATIETFEGLEQFEKNNGWSRLYELVKSDLNPMSDEIARELYGLMDQIDGGGSKELDSIREDVSALAEEIFEMPYIKLNSDARRKKAEKIEEFEREFRNLEYIVSIINGIQEDDFLTVYRCLRRFNYIIDYQSYFQDNEIKISQLGKEKSTNLISELETVKKKQMAGLDKFYNSHRASKMENVVESFFKESHKMYSKVDRQIGKIDSNR